MSEIVLTKEVIDFLSPSLKELSDISDELNRKKGQTVKLALRLCDLPVDHPEKWQIVLKENKIVLMKV